MIDVFDAKKIFYYIVCNQMCDGDFNDDGAYEDTQKWVDFLQGIDDDYYNITDGFITTYDILWAIGLSLNNSDGAPQRPVDRPTSVKIIYEILCQADLADVTDVLGFYVTVTQIMDAFNIWKHEYQSMPDMGK
jgi:hypothetical protein